MFMKKNILFVGLIVFAIFVISCLVLNPVFAGDVLPEDGGGTVDVTSGAIFTNPLKNGVDSLPGLLGLILDIMVQIGTTVVIIAIIYAGFLYTTARGNERQIEKAHTVIKGVLIGSAIILGAFVIAQVIKETAEDVIEGVMIERNIA